MNAPPGAFFLTMQIEAIQAAIEAATGQPLDVPCVRRVHGGNISEAALLDDGERRYFVKCQPASRYDLFEAEADGLATLGRHLRVPAVVTVGTAAGEAFLVLEALELHARGDAAALGSALVRLHRAPQAGFGWPRDNWIGSAAQANRQSGDWVAFWRDQRLVPQFARAAQNGFGAALLRDGERLMVDLPGLLAGHAPAPSLLHGDLWGGNHAYLADGSPVLFDPAVYVGDRECDLAMSELFGGFAPAFHAAYHAAWPLDAGYATRKTLYNLYHILNHANLFDGPGGGSYAAQAARMTARLLAEMR